MYQTQIDDDQTTQNPKFRGQSNIFSKLLLYWVYKTMDHLQEQDLDIDKIEDLSDEEKSQELYKRFQRNLSIHQSSSNWLIVALTFTLWKELAIYFFLLVFSASVSTIIPILIKLILQYKEQEMITDVDNQEGITHLIFCIIFLKLSLMISLNQSKYIMRRLGYDAQSIIQVACMKKCLDISFLSNTSHSSGQVINLLQVDAVRIGTITFFLGQVLISPIQLILATALLFYYLGNQFSIAFIVLMLCLLFNAFLGKMIQKKQKKLLFHKDIRTSYTNQILNQIKFIKVNAYEEYFEENLKSFRLDEIKAIKEKTTYQSLCSFSAWTTPILILITTYTTIIYSEGELNSSLAFLIVGLTYMLQQPMIQFPQAFSEIISAQLSFDRIKEFLETEELMKQSITYSNDCDPQFVNIENGTFYWSSMQTPIIQSISTKLQGAQLVAVIGEIGAGKSSLLYAILGEMKYDHEKPPKINVNGRMAYVGQKPWIINATVKDNILFGTEYEETRYQQTIYYSCLGKDLQILQNGDETMIGEKGLNLSGGQKARIALARAIYSDADIYLFDDILSAVDVYVGNFIMEECLKKYLIQRNKLVILITHSINYVHKMDYIIEMYQGKIIDQGPQDQFQNNLIGVDDSQPKEEQVKIQKKEGSEDEMIIKEEKDDSSVDRQLVLDYLQYTGGFALYGFLIVLQLMWIYTYVQCNIILAIWTDNNNLNQSSSEDTNLYLHLYVGLSFVQGILTFFRPFVQVRNAADTSNKLHNEMISSIMKASQCDYFERIPIGRLLNRFTGDLNTLDVEIGWNFNGISSQTSQLISGAILLIYSSSLTMIFPILLYLWICWYIKNYYVKSNIQYQRLESISRSPILSYFTEIISNGLTTVRAYQTQDQVFNKHVDNINNHRKIFILLTASSVWFTITLGLLSLLLNSLIMIYCLFYLDSTAAQIGVLLTFSTSLDQYIGDSTQAVSNFQLNLVAFDRCQSLKLVPPEQDVTDKAQTQVTLSQDNTFISDWPTEGKIEFHKFSVKYRENLPFSLQNFSVVFRPSEKVGVVGRTGAGKSTLTLSLLRILQRTTGQILIDDIDITNLSLTQLRRNITIIMQDSYLFQGTIRDNLDPFQQNSDKEILDVLKQCCLQQLLDSRDGLNSQIGDSSINLSEGEKQLLCIARAVLKKAKIILIDEATSNIDLETDKQIQNTIQTCFKDCTVITIAHRIQTILYCNKILVIDEGQVAEYDDTTKLLQNKQSKFYQIYQEANEKGYL